MKYYPKTIYVTRNEPRPDEPDFVDDFYVTTNKKKTAEEEDEGTEVAIYQLISVGVVIKSSKIVFDK